MHKYPLENKYSGRPQIIDDENSLIYKILENEKEQLTGPSVGEGPDYMGTGLPRSPASSF